MESGPKYHSILVGPSRVDSIDLDINSVNNSHTHNRI